MESLGSLACIFMTISRLKLKRANKNTFNKKIKILITYKKLRFPGVFFRYPNAADVDMILKFVATCNSPFVGH